jgi:hypothetical protein
VAVIGDLASIVAHQLRALGNGTFELGIQERDTGHMRLRTRSSAAILDSLDVLRAKNANHHFIRVRPKWPHPFVLIDDVEIGHVQALDEAGLSASVVVESSPGSFQVWLDLGRCVTKDATTLIARKLASLADGDRGAANWRQAGALAGFMNCKKKHRRGDGSYPLIQLHLARRQVFERAEVLIAYAEQAEASQRKRWKKVRALYASARGGTVKPIAAFHAHPRYEGDLHRADLGWAIHALSNALGDDEVRRTILTARDLRHKGSRREQERYAARTVRAAYRKGLGQVYEREFAPIPEPEGFVR